MIFLQHCLKPVFLNKKLSMGAWFPFMLTLSSSPWHVDMLAPQSPLITMTLLLHLADLVSSQKKGSGPHSLLPRFFESI